MKHLRQKFTWGQGPFWVGPKLLFLIKLRDVHAGTQFCNEDVQPRQRCENGERHHDKHVLSRLHGQPFCVRRQFGKTRD